MKHNRILWFLAAAVTVCIVLAVVAKRNGWIGEGSVVKVAVAKAERRDIVETVTASGRVFPQSEVKISPEVPGEITELPVKEGDSVKQGDVLAKINPVLYIAGVDRAGAGVNTARANQSGAQARLEQVRAQLEKAGAEYRRSKTLLEKGVISPADFESAETSYKSLQSEAEAAEQSVRAAAFGVANAQAALKEAKDNLGKTVITSPVTGIVSRLSVERGERVVGTSQFSGTEMMRIAGFDDMEARVDVSENDILRVQPGDSAVIEIDAYHGRKFKGVVTETAGSANLSEQGLSDQVINFTVKVRILKESYADLLADRERGRYVFHPGMSASVEIITRKAAGVLAVPIRSVTVREKEKNDSSSNSKPAEDKQKEIVFLYSGGKVLSVEVSTGIQDDAWIQVVESKPVLKAGDEAVVAPFSAVSRKLKDRDAVKVVKEEELWELVEE